jgi:hypothetical protein
MQQDRGLSTSQIRVRSTLRMDSWWWQRMPHTADSTMPASRLGMCMPPTLPIPPPLTTAQSPREAAGADGSEVYSEAPEVVLVWTRVPTR